MSINDFLVGAEASQYTEIFELQVGEKIHYFTSYSEDFVFAGITYKKSPISIQKIKNDSKVQPIPMKIEIDLQEPFNEFISVVPSEIIRLKATIVLIDDPSENEVLYEGRVVSESANSDLKVSINLESHTDAFRTKVPNRNHSPFCNNILFDRTCGLLEALFTVEATISSISGDFVTLTSSSFGLENDDYYFLGKCKTSYNDVRMIVDHVGDNITIHFPFDSRVGVGSKVKVTPGCDRLRETCDAKFGNTENYVGMGDIPVRNIAVFGLEKTDRRSI